MPIWSDNFNRADGPPGANWANVPASASIVGNDLHLTGDAYLRAGPVSGPGSAMAQVTVVLGTNEYNGPGPAVKMSSGGSQCYHGHAQAGTGQVTYRIRTTNMPTENTVASYVWSGTVPSSVTLRLTYSGGTLTLYADGVQMCQGTNTTYAANSGVGIFNRGSAYTCDDFQASGDGQPALYVTPAVVGTEDGDVPITLMATAVSWTPGTPGSPSFTCNAGALNSQVVDSTTNARAIFSPPLTAQVVTITDPVAAITDTITVVEGTYLGGGTGGAGGLSETAVGWIEAQAARGAVVLAPTDPPRALVTDTASHTDGDLTTTDTIVAAGLPDNLDLTLVNAIADLWYAQFRSATSPPSGWGGGSIGAVLWDILNGGVEHTSEDDVFSLVQAIDTNVDSILTKWATLIGVPEYALGDVIAAIKGLDNRSLTEVYDLVDGLSGSDLQPVLDAIAALRGDTTSTVMGVLQAISAIRTGSNHTLQSTIDRTATAETNIRNDVAAAALTITAISTLLGTVNTAVSGLVETAGDILDIVTSLQAAAPTPQAPVWAGLDNVTIGQSVALSDGLELTGPLDGVLVHITTAPARAGRYAFGDINSWRYVGAVVFRSDRGDYEWNHPIGLDSQVITPKTMTHAAAARFRLEGGWAGTVRPFTVGSSE